jgi:hypothetical protein
MSVIFKYIHPDVNPNKAGKQPSVRTLQLRHNPNSVSWIYNVNTATRDTYGGQVLQVLSVDIDKLTIEGQLGKEGVFGVEKASSLMTDPRWGGKVPQGGFSTRSGSNQFTYNNATYPGLHAMVEFFREYFAVVSQGGDSQNPGRYIQVPMTVTYGNTYTDMNANGNQVSGGSRTWTISPVSFPSFRRANDNFAPEWQVQCQVIEADRNIIYKEKQSAIARLQSAIGYTIRNPFSDPAANPSYNATLINNQIASQWKSLLPKFSQGDLEDMIWQNITVPSISEGAAIDKSILNSTEYLQGEIGTAASGVPTRVNPNQDK